MTKKKPEVEFVGVRSFTIDRSRWLCGELTMRERKAGREEESFSVLCDVDGRMCCLGFYSEACGVSRRTLRDETMPRDLPTRSQEKLHPKLRGGVYERGPAQMLIHINDNENTRAILREQRIVNQFKRLGIAVNFVGEYPVIPKEEDK